VRRLALVGALGAVLGAAPASAGRPAPARLLVEAREFNFTLSRTQIKPGVAIVQLANRGEDPHDLRIKRVGGQRRGTIAKTLPDEVGEWEGRLSKGRFRLICTIEGHEALGMRATLRVR
jgi:plastocyanin